MQLLRVMWIKLSVGIYDTALLGSTARLGATEFTRRSAGKTEKLTACTSFYRQAFLHISSPTGERKRREEKRYDRLMNYWNLLRLGYLHLILYETIKRIPISNKRRKTLVNWWFVFLRELVVVFSGWGRGIQEGFSRRWRGRGRGRLLRRKLDYKHNTTHHKTREEKRREESES